MNRLVPKILPKDIWNLAFDYLLYYILLEGKKFSKYEYITNTFAKNTSYINNEHQLNPGTVEEKTSLYGNNSYDKDLFRNVLSKIMTSNNIGMIIHLQKKLTLDNIMVYEMLERTCGCLEILKYFAKIVDITCGSWRNNAISYASSAGHLETVIYLVEIAGVTQKNTAYGVSCAIFYASCKGHYEIIEYLTRALELTHSNIDVYNTFHQIVINNDLIMLKYLVETFKLTSKNMTYLMHRVERYSKGGISKYLKKTFELE